MSTGSTFWKATARWNVLWTSYCTLPVFDAWLHCTTSSSSLPNLFCTWTNVRIVGKTICACWLSHSPSLVRSCRQVKAITISYSKYHWYKIYYIAGNINRVIKLTVWQFSESLPSLILHHYLKYTHYTLYYIRINRYVYVVAVDMASPAAVSTEGRTCAEVLHSLSKGDKTGEGRRKWFLASDLAMKRNRICGAYSDYTPENRTMGGTYNTKQVPARATRHFAAPKSWKQRREGSH